MSKIKILAISNDQDGVGYYRINSPYLALNDPDIEVKFLSNTDFTFRFTEDVIKDFNIIVYHKGIPFKDKNNSENFHRLVKKYDIKMVFDIDDHWDIHPSHINYRNWKQSNSRETVLSHLRTADYITTTTPYFATDIMEFNKNVLIVENAVNTDEFQWIPKKVESDKTRFIWGGGITHKPDLMLLKDSFKSFNKNFLSKTQMVMCGYDLRMRTKDGVYMDDPRRSVWTQFESIFTNSWKWVTNSEHGSWLRKHQDMGRLNYGYNEKFKDEFYQRRWTKPILTYGTMYNEADVVVSPLKSGMKFNKVKSQLKIIEAGVHKMPVIASNFGPYTIDVIEGKHGFLINENDKMGWADKMKFFVENPSAVTEMGEALNELVLEKYTLKKVNQKRIDLFKHLVSN